MERLLAFTMKMLFKNGIVSNPNINDSVEEIENPAIQKIWRGDAVYEGYQVNPNQDEDVIMEDEEVKYDYPPTPVSFTKNFNFF